MTALLAIFGPRASLDDRGITAALSVVSSGHDAISETWRGPEALVAAARLPWETDVDRWTGPLIHESDDLVIAADASLHYVDDLRRTLARHVDVSCLRTSGELIAAAVRQYGRRFASVVEGDFSVIVWERDHRTVLLSRDFCGRRALYFAMLSDDSLVVASHLLSFTRVARVPTSYDLDVLAASAGCLMAYGDRTAFSSVQTVTSATTRLWTAGHAVQVADRWNPPAFSDAWHDATRDEAARELRRLLERAVVERLPVSGGASVWMSGGWDSTAVFGAGQGALSAAARPRSDLLPVSVSYPPDDAGHEDHFIRDVAERWSVNVSWIAADSIPLLDDYERRACSRDDPMAHHFEAMQRTLAQATRALGARVALDGFGGDQLFKCSPESVLTDHLLRSRWTHFARAWHRLQDRSPAEFARRCLLPIAPPELRSWLSTVTGRSFAGPLELPLPAWLSPRETLLRDLVPKVTRDPDEAVSAFEARFFLNNPYINRVIASTHLFALDEGVRLRSPLYDPRVVVFAAGRPQNERNDGREVKTILRRAMDGLLPESVLAPRLKKTGISADYFRRQLPCLLQARFGGKPGRSRSMLLADLGLIEPRRLHESVERFLAEPENLLGAQLFTTYETETWLAAREGKL